MSDGSEAVRMEIKGLLMDPSSNTPIVVLRDEASEIFLPIWIGVVEANAIALGIESISAPRPMTHDVLQLAITALGASVQRITISDLRDNTFYARLTLRGHDDQNVDVDCRPSDAIALALRAKAPIYVLRQVLQHAEATDLVLDSSDEERLREWLESIDPEELGEYKM